MQKLISVIIPVYQAEKWLDKCITSIRNQSYNNLEIICINDGSTDLSQEILERHAKEDKRVIVKYKENGGESSARNVGIRLAKGDFLTFVDNDDFLDNQMYFDMIEISKKHDVDIVATGWYNHVDGVSEEIKNLDSVKNGVLNQEEFLFYLYKRDRYRSFAYMWNKIYKKEVFINKDGSRLEFDEDIVIGGDVIMLGRLVLNAKSFYFLDKAYYHYLQRLDSGCHSKNITKRKDWIISYVKLIEFMELDNINTEIIDLLKRFMVYHGLLLAEITIEENDKEAFNWCKDVIVKHKEVYIEQNKGFDDRIEWLNKIVNTII